MSWLKQFLEDHKRLQLPPGPPGSAEIVIYDQVDDNRQLAVKRTTLSLTLVNVGLTLVNVVVFALLVLS